MTECWSEGELRAYLDRELPPEELQRAALHLAECGECARRSAELERRAGWVADWIAALPETERVEPVQRRRWWLPAAAGLAAALALAAWLTPRRTEPPIAAVPAVVVRPVEPPVVTEAAAEPLAAPRVRRSVPKGRVALNDGFVRLDDEPFETGVVVRMALGPRGVPADVVFGSDGRARAIRLVSNNIR